MSLQIRPSTYRGEAGFLVCGTDKQGRRVSIFTGTRRSAVEIRRKVKVGLKIDQADFKL
jgi:hypothetical protein